MTARAKRVWIPVLVGVASVLIAAIPYLEVVLYPGLLIASLFWPEGVHSDNMGKVGAVLFLITIYLGTAAFWGGLAYAIVRRKEPAGSSEPSAS